ncbi:hypothetical protein BJY04DRAFT_99785 [Aspergillus karnatakaensis]|uniref:uncharacterized protein n=1 Tax=Aspergillus karnatakaensis TaxID=1810916 RepID=UPI003CCCC6DA
MTVQRPRTPPITPLGVVIAWSAAHRLQPHHSLCSPSPCGACRNMMCFCMLRLTVLSIFLLSESLDARWVECCTRPTVKACSVC